MTEQIPQPVQRALDGWGRDALRVAAADAQITYLDGRMAELRAAEATLKQQYEQQVAKLRKTLGDLKAGHATAGRERTAAMRDLELSHWVAEQACGRSGVDMPAEPPDVDAGEEVVPCPPCGVRMEWRGGQWRHATDDTLACFEPDAQKGGVEALLQLGQQINGTRQSTDPLASQARVADVRDRPEEAGKEPGKKVASGMRETRPQEAVPPGGPFPGGGRG